MNELGDLPPCTWEQIDTVLARFPRLRWVKLYGSRAMGCQRPASDIDLAFSSPEDCSAALAGAFEELPIPYKVDVTHWESLSHAGLRRHIETVGIPLERQPTSAGRLHLTARDADRDGQPSTRGWSPLPTAPTGGNR